MNNLSVRFDRTTGVAVLNLVLTMFLPSVYAGKPIKSVLSLVKLHSRLIQTRYRLPGF